MAARLVAAVAIALCALAAPAQAQTKVQAPPLVGPSSRLPPPADTGTKAVVPTVPVGAKTVRIVNIANQNLGLAYWDGMVAWHDITVPSGGSADVNCPSCGATLTVRFNNGAAVETRQVTLGTVVQLQWSEATKRWALVTTAN